MSALKRASRWAALLRCNRGKLQLKAPIRWSPWACSSTDTRHETGSGVVGLSLHAIPAANAFQDRRCPASYRDSELDEPWGGPPETYHSISVVITHLRSDGTFRFRRYQAIGVSPRPGTVQYLTLPCRAWVVERWTLPRSTNTGGRPGSQIKQDIRTWRPVEFHNPIHRLSGLLRGPIQELTSRARQSRWSTAESCAHLI